MKFLIGALIAITSCSVFANGRCMSSSTINKESCTPIEIPALMYHQVTDSKPLGETIVGTSKFAEQMSYLQANGYKTITASELTEFLNGNIQLPSKTVVLTFDDGWKSGLNAVRVLNGHNFSATFYAVSGFVNDPEYLTESELMLLAQNKNFEIGAHTHTHFMEWADKMDSLDSRTMIGEIAMSKILIEHAIGVKVKSFAWPFGYIRSDVMKMISDMGFTSTMLVTSDSNNSVGMSPLQVRRINIDGRCNIVDFEEMLQTKHVKACNDESNKTISR
jgi:peptidoglycan/xylan/chitin deacetylase (PgdA/CDA1 family)